MLENVIAPVLNRVLGTYVKNFNTKDLNIGIWSGDVKLRNLELRREALDALKLPINVVEGHLGVLTLKIPWSNPFSQPVQIDIEDLFVLAAPKEDAEYNEEEEERRRQAVKMEKLESAELLKDRNEEGMSTEDQQKNQSFTNNLVTRIVDNLQVTVKNIHVRYEDSISAPGHPLALGLTLAEFSAVSTDGNWEQTYIQNSSGLTHKLATLGALAVYFNTDTKLLGTGRETKVEGVKSTPHDEMLSKFKEMIVQGEEPNSANHQFILKPVSGHAKIEIDKSGKNNAPRLKASLGFDEIGLVLDDSQYREALLMIDMMHYFKRHIAYKKDQPKGVTPKQDPRAWIRFAGKAVLKEIHEKNRRWSWAYFQERRDDRVRYIELFKKKKRAESTLSEQDVTALKELEAKLTYEDMRFWRSMARNQMKKENVGVKKAAPAQKQGWIAWAWGSKPEEKEADPETELTEEQRAELYKAIDWDERNALAASVDLPKDTVKMQIDASLNTGSFALKQNAHGETAELLSLYFDAFHAKILQRPESFLADVSLGGLRVNDGTTPKSLFPQIVRVKDAPDTPRPTSQPSESAHTEDIVDPFFHFQFEKNPLDGASDLALTGQLKPLEIIWNPLFLTGIVRFFKPPKTNMESIEALMQSAGATVEGLQRQGRAGLEFALEEHKTLNAKLDLQAPLIIVPESMIAESTTCLIIDAGKISVNSQLIDKDTLKEVQAKQSQPLTDDDQKKLESLMYDKFSVKLSSTQVLIGPSIAATKAQLETRDEAKSMHVVDKINVDFIVEISIVPKVPNLAKVRVSGNLPVLHASVSDKKYKSLMRLIDVAIPNTGDDAESQTTPNNAVVSKASVDNKNSELSKEQDKPHSTPFPFSMQEAIILHDESDDDADESFVDARSTIAVSDELRVQQRNFVLRFEVDRLQGSLFRSDPEGKKPDQLLVELVAEHFKLDLSVRPYDLIISTSLGSIVVDDYIENPSAEFKSIVSSGDKETNEHKDLIRVRLDKVKPESPEFMPKWEGTELNIDVAVSTINLVVTRKTLLTLLDFILITFTNNDNQPSAMPSKQIKGAETEEVAPPPPPSDSGSIRIKIDLKKIVLILNNDGIRLATLSLNAADVGVFLMGKTMRIVTKLGNLSLLDDINQGASSDSMLRKLVTIQGDDLADFHYETYDSSNEESYPGYDSLIYLRAGSIKVHFLEEPFRKIIDFLVKFGQMQALFNAARNAAANQASQIQQNAARIKFDVNIKTPIVVFPRVMISGRQKRDLLTAYLGEIYAENKFVPLDDSKNSPIATKLSAGIRNIRLTSEFNFADDKSEELELIDKVDLGFQLTYAEHSDGMKRPDLEIEGSMTDFNLRLTQIQLKFLLELAKSVPAAFAGDTDGSDLQVSIDKPTSKPNKTTEIQKQEDMQRIKRQADLGPELGVDESCWTKLDLSFQVHTVGLELILAKEDKPLGPIESSSLSKFSLDDTKVKLRMMTDGSMESELLIHSFTIQDSRTHSTNKFRKIMTSSNKDVQQFMASVTISGGEERDLIAILAIDSPRVIFALDYLFSIQEYISGGLTTEEPTVTDDDESLISSAEASEANSIHAGGEASPTLSRSRSTIQGADSGGSPTSGTPSMNISFRANVVDAQIILIANPLSSSSEAIVLGTKEILISQQHALTLQVTNVGMFLCRMDRFEDSRLRILDDFSTQMFMDSSQADTTSIHVDIEPLVLRLSLRDILLALQIVSKASELSNSDSQNNPKVAASDEKVKQLQGRSGSTLKQRTASGKNASTMAHKKRSSVALPKKNEQQPAKQIIKKHEELTATLDGMRIILIGDLHELPILDISVKNFTTTATDWTSHLKASTNIDLFVNIYNFSKSTWEPLIEPWDLGLQVYKDTPECMSIDLASKKTLELTVTSATIALASKSATFLAQEKDVLSKPRGSEAPYRIRNYTGFNINVWADVPGEESSMAAKLEDGEEAPWRFEDGAKMRENLTPESNTGIVGVRLEGSDFDSINSIPINREGEVLYRLRPKRDQISHLLLVEVTLGTDNVKYVTFRSPLLVENKTQIPIEIGVYDVQEGTLLKIEKIAPGESRPAPVGVAYLKALLVRPDVGFGYTWSSETLWWRDLLKKPTRTMTCKGDKDPSLSPFHFQTHASWDRSNPHTRTYPYMRIKVSAPVELENLLPYDFNYRLYDKTTKKDWTNFLRKGGVSPLHVVELSRLLLMSIEMQDTVFKKSEFAIINSSRQEDYKKEDTLVCKDNDGLTLKLKLHYFEIPDSGGAFRVTVYSPYVILNKTGLDLNIKAKSLLQGTRVAAGQNFHNDAADQERRKALPLMFSYGDDDKRQRVVLRLGNSQWSKPQSFDAIGSTIDVVLPSSSGDSEVHVGISIESGDGKYKMTRVVTMAPRFILKNQMSEEIIVREPGSSEFMTLKPNALQPLHFLQRSTAKQLSICFPGVNNQWSSPFNISDLGTIHVKLAKVGQRQKLIRVDILMENATIFLHLSSETKHWPFTMRNESDMEFMFWQANPHLDDPDVEDRSGWKPIRYRLPSRSIMPYAWDYPAARNKELIVNANGKERHIKLAEIGSLLPFNVSGQQSSNGQRVSRMIELNVVADGPTQTLVLSNYNQKQSMYKQKSRNESTTSVTGGFEVKDLDTGVTMKAQLKLAGVGISLVNAQLKELAYLTLRGISLQYSESPVHQTITTAIKWVQIDNQLYGGIFPMILYPSVVPKNNSETESHPSVHAMVTRSKDDSFGVIYIKYATLLLQQMTLEIDEDFVYALLDFSKVPGASWSEVHEGVLCDENLDIPEPKQQQSGQDIYFELLNIQPMQLDLSFVRTDRVNVEENKPSGNPISFFLDVLTMAIGNINDAPVRLNALMLENARVSTAVLTQNVSSHYSQEGLYQIHKILGSADFLGNPVGLFNNISSGVADIFYEPYQGFIMADRPEQFGIGIAKGATSFVKKSVFGVSDSVTKFTGSIAKGLSEATMDKQFQNRRRMSRTRNRPKHALYGVTQGANSFVRSLTSGVGGLVTKPLEGINEGPVGFFKGVGKGVLGLATKPALGIFDLASNVSEGIRNTTTVFDADGLDRVRLTRFIGQDGIVRPYSQREALGQFWLKQLDSGKYFNELYLAHLELPREDVVVMLTYSRIMLIKSKKLTTEWDAPMNEISAITKERTGLNITLNDGHHGPFIPVAEETSRNFLYQKIAVAVNEYNKIYKARQ